ncbi:MAG: tetratricopeptide repeat protein [Cyanobacteria bacterium SZAS LIN-3]|nr:tetratricopeptide repeat protein [Cyanobacteria bacterium SZAS LIN-3]
MFAVSCGSVIGAWAQSSESAELYFKRAMSECSDLKLQDRAPDDFATAIRLAPRRADFRVGLANYLFDCEEDEAALKAADEALALDEKNPLAWAIKGKCLARQKKAAEGLKAMNRAVDLSPNNLAFYRDRARLYMLSGQNAQAEKDLDRVIAGNRLMMAPLADRIEVYRRQKKWSQMIGDCNTFLLVDRAHHSQIYRSRSLAYEGLGEYPKAIQDLQSAVKASPDNLQLHEALQALYKSVGDAKGVAREAAIIAELLKDYR